MTIKPQEVDFAVKELLKMACLALIILNCWLLYELTGWLPFSFAAYLLLVPLLFLAVADAYGLLEWTGRWWRGSQ